MIILEHRLNPSPSHTPDIVTTCPVLAYDVTQQWLCTIRERRLSLFVAFANYHDGIGRPVDVRSFTLVTSLRRMPESVKSEIIAL